MYDSDDDDFCYKRFCSESMTNSSDRDLERFANNVFSKFVSTIFALQNICFIFLKNKVLIYDSKLVLIWCKNNNNNNNKITHYNNNDTGITNLE